MYSSKLGMAFSRSKGRYIVDKTYMYSVSDDVKKVRNSNNIACDLISAEALMEWENSELQKSLDMQRRVCTYDSDFTLIANESQLISDRTSSTLPVATATAVLKEDYGRPAQTVGAPTTRSPAEPPKVWYRTETRIQLIFISELHECRWRSFYHLINQRDHRVPSFL